MTDRNTLWQFNPRQAMIMITIIIAMILITFELQLPDLNAEAEQVPCRINFELPGLTILSGQTGDAVKLLDGRVLIAGGLLEEGAVLFDPVPMTVVPTGNMNYRRFGHRLTLLNDGSVLVTGGVSTSAAEIYDPASGTCRVASEGADSAWPIGNRPVVGG